MKKAWIEHADDDGMAFVHAVSGDALDTLMTYCREAADVQRPGGDMKLAASVDTTVIIDWCNKRGVTFNRFMNDQGLQNAFLDDPANAPFRIWKGRI